MIVNDSAINRHSIVLCHVVQVVNEKASQRFHSPTIEELSNRTGYTEENILESMEFGEVSANTLLQ